jgi:hypothetical protein
VIIVWDVEWIWVVTVFTVTLRKEKCSTLGVEALYGMLIASLLWYQLFRRILKPGYKFNPDPCVTNKCIHGKKHTIRFHVDDRAAMLTEVNDKFRNG